jgi:glutathione peroxidase
MQSLQKQYEGKPVNLLLFPCNQFLFQEPGENSVIKTFAETYLNLTAGNVKLFSKSGCNTECKTSGSDQCTPSSKRCCTANNGIYDYLKSVVPGSLSWNFNKFLVGKDGVPVAPRYGDDTYAKTLEADIDKLLQA